MGVAGVGAGSPLGMSAFGPIHLLWWVVGDYATRCQQHVPSRDLRPWPVAWLSILTPLWGRGEVVCHPGGAGKEKVQGGETLRASAVFSAECWSPFGPTLGPGGVAPHSCASGQKPTLDLSGSISGVMVSLALVMSTAKVPLGGVACGGLRQPR